MPYFGHGKHDSGLWHIEMAVLSWRVWLFFFLEGSVYNACLSDTVITPGLKKKKDSPTRYPSQQCCVSPSEGFAVGLLSPFLNSCKGDCQSGGQGFTYAWRRIKKLICHPRSAKFKLDLNWQEYLWKVKVDVVILTTLTIGCPTAPKNIADSTIYPINLRKCKSPLPCMSWFLELEAWVDYFCHDSWN